MVRYANRDAWEGSMTKAWNGYAGAEGFSDAAAFAHWGVASRGAPVVNVERNTSQHGRGDGNRSNECSEMHFVDIAGGVK